MSLLTQLTRPPHTLGLDADRLHRAETLLATGIRDQFYPAFAYAVIRKGLVGAYGAQGIAQPEANPPLAATTDTIFDMASLTKTVTATLLLQCVEDGLLHLQQEVRQHLPELESAPVGPVSLHDLATHTSGLPAWKALYQTVPPNPLGDIAATPLIAKPGEKYTYSDLGYILLGLTVARVRDKPLDVLAHDRVFGPLDMTRSGYRPTPAWQAQIAATGQGETEPGKRHVGDVHDPNAWGLGGIAGHAGVFSTLPDMLRFVLAFQFPDVAAQHGLPRLLGPLAHRLASTRQTDPNVGGHTIGWFTTPNGYLPRGDLLSLATFGHTGFTGTSLLFDPENDLALLLLTNRVYYEKHNDGSGVLRLRRLWHNAVAGAITH